MTIKDKLDRITSQSPSNAVEHTAFRQSQPWLRAYSSQIARRIIALIRDNKELNQVKLAESLNVSKQYINKIIKGEENLTLETIYKLSKALNVELISFPPYQYSVIDKKNRVVIQSVRETSSNEILNWREILVSLNHGLVLNDSVKKPADSKTTANSDFAFAA